MNNNNMYMNKDYNNNNLGNNLINDNNNYNSDKSINNSNTNYINREPNNDNINDIQTSNSNWDNSKNIINSYNNIKKDTNLINKPPYSNNTSSNQNAQLINQNQNNMNKRYLDFSNNNNNLNKEFNTNNNNNIINPHIYDSIKTKNSSYESLLSISNNRKISNPNRIKGSLFENDDERKINILMKKIKENNEKILVPLQEIKNEKQKQIKEMEKKDKEIERLKRREEEKKLGIKDYLNIVDNDSNQYEEENEIEKQPIRESMFKKLVHLTNMNYSQSTTEPNYDLYNKIKVSKESPISNKKVNSKYYFTNLSSSNNKSKEHLIFSSHRDYNNSIEDNFYNQSKTPNKEIYHFEYKGDKEKKEKQKKDKFYGEENKPDFFGLRSGNETSKLNKKESDKLIKSSERYINSDRIAISNSNSKKSLRSNNMFGNNNQNINLRDRGFPNNFIMPVNPMNDVLSAKVNYLYGDND